MFTQFFQFVIRERFDTGMGVIFLCQLRLNIVPEVHFIILGVRPTTHRFQTTGNKCPLWGFWCSENDRVMNQVLINLASFDAVVNELIEFGFQLKWVYIQIFTRELNSVFNL
ncbi:hypothetical protein D3C75_612100 [compost metagenome]